MTPDPHALTSPPITALEPSRQLTRLQLDEGAPRRGDVDGAWWPRSHVLATELPGLLGALTPRLGRIALVVYHLNDWDPGPDTITLDGDTVRLENVSATSQGLHAVAVIAADGQCVTLALVAPDTTEARAHATLTAAASTHQDDIDEGNHVDVQEAIGGDIGEEIASAATAATTRALDDVADRLIRHTEPRTEKRAADIAGWVRDAASQFTHAPIQTYVPILVENIVRNRLAAAAQG